jgi:hypothetical protein
MSSDIDIKDQLWLTVRAEGGLELNMDDGVSTMHVCLCACSPCIMRAGTGARRRLPPTTTNGET